MKQTTTKSKPAAKKSNVVVGGSSKSNRKLKLFALAAVAVLVLTIGGFFGYSKYQAHNLKAHAAYYAKLLPPGDQRGHQIYACKYSSPWGYGIRVIGEQNGPEPNNYFSVSTSRTPYTGGGTVGLIEGKITRTFWDGKVAVLQAYVTPDGWYYTQLDGYSAAVAVGYTPFC